MIPAWRLKVRYAREGVLDIDATRLESEFESLIHAPRQVDQSWATLGRCLGSQGD